MLQVYTTRINPKLKDPDALDVTRSGADRGSMLSRGIGGAFAPSVGLLLPYIRLRKEGKDTPDDWERYRESYIREMRESYRGTPRPWRILLAWNRVVLVCFCTDAEHCHRTLLGREILPKLGAHYHGEL